MTTTNRGGDRWGGQAPGPKIETWRDEPEPPSRGRRVLLVVSVGALLFVLGVGAGSALTKQDEARAPAPAASIVATKRADPTAVFVIVQTREQALSLEAAMRQTNDPSASRDLRDWFVVVQAGTQGLSDMNAAVKPFLDSGYVVRFADLSAR